MLRLPIHQRVFKQAQWYISRMQNKFEKNKKQTRNDFNSEEINKTIHSYNTALV